MCLSAGARLDVTSKHRAGAGVLSAKHLAAIFKSLDLLLFQQFCRGNLSLKTVSQAFYYFGLFSVL